MSVEILRPNGVGDETNIGWNTGGANWENVDEATADDATTAIAHNVDGASARDLYVLPNSAVGSGTINKVTVYIRFEGVTAWSRTAIKTEATVYESANKTTASDDTWELQSEVYTNNPNTGSAWTWTQIDALQVGAVNYRDPAQQGRITQIYVEVDYTGSVTITPTTLSSTFSLIASTIVLGALFTATTLSITSSIITPTIVTSQVLPVSTQVATFSTIAHTVVANDVVHSASVVSSTFSIPSVSLKLDMIFSVNTLTFTTGMSVITPTILTSQILSVSTQGATFSVQTPTIKFGQTITPSTLSATFATITPSITTQTLLTPSTLTATFGVITPSVISNQIFSVSPVTATFSTIARTKVGGLWRRVGRPDTGSEWSRVARPLT